MVSDGVERIQPTMTYHNLHAIKEVVIALVAMESAIVVVDRTVIRGFVVKAMGPMGVNAHAQQATDVPGSVKIQHNGTISRQMSIHPRVRSTE